MIQNIPLSKLVPSRKNCRRVKPEADAHRRLVASIRSFGLLEPLVVRPAEGNANRFEVIAGHRRLEALKEVHKGTKDDPKITCEVRKVDDSEAGALSLSENFAREAMHPLDEAQAFAALAGDEGKQADAIAAEFGVSAKYVKQRMKLANLADPIRIAYRTNKIDTATAEAFAAVPPDRQLLVWKELKGNPRHADHVRNVIANAWVDAEHALFDLATLRQSAVSRDLFSDKVLVERSAFMEAQANQLVKEKEALLEEGWKEVVIGAHNELQDRLWSMAEAPVMLDAEVKRKLAKIDEQFKKLEAAARKLKPDNEKGRSALEKKFNALQVEAHRIECEAPRQFKEEIKAVGTVFLLLDADGQVRREYRVPRPGPKAIGNGNGRGGGSGSAPEPPKPPTSDDLSDSQLAEVFTHQALAVREALLDNSDARKRVLALILHEKIRSEALAIRPDANGVTLHATHEESFASPALDRLRKLRSEFDPFKDEPQVPDCEAYERLGKLKASIEDLIDLLTVECITAHMHRPTQLVCLLAEELSVDVRKLWHPDAKWLSGYQKLQLSHLLAELYGPTYSPDHERRKKSELVQAAAKLFSEAAEGKVSDKGLSERVNRWVPVGLRAATVADDRT